MLPLRNSNQLLRETSPMRKPMPDPPDAELARASQAGDAAAFAELMQRYERLVFKIAYNKSGNRADAEDLCQEIFLHAFRSLPNLRDPQAFLGWLMAIANNRSHRFYQRKRAKITALEEARRDLEQRQVREGAAEEEDCRVVELVHSLPEEFRSVLTWKYLEGCSYEEIGERLSMSFNQVDYLLRRAKTALRKASESDRRNWEGQLHGSE